MDHWPCIFLERKGSTKQFDSLLQFCATSLMIVNETKDKVMILGDRKNLTFYFNNKTIENVEQYEYLKVLRSSINYRQTSFTTNKDRRTVFSMYKKTTCLGALPMTIVFRLHQHLIKAILLYVREICGISDPANSQIDTFLVGSFAVHRAWNLPHALPWSMASVDRYLLVYGRTRMCLLHSAHPYNLLDINVVKQVYNELSKLSNCGFTT